MNKKVIILLILIIGLPPQQTRANIFLKIQHYTFFYAIPTIATFLGITAYLTYCFSSSKINQIPKKPDQKTMDDCKKLIAKILEKYYKSEKFINDPSKTAKNNKCSICLEDIPTIQIQIQNNEFAIDIKCGCKNSIYHINCMKKWKDTGRTNRLLCPTCRQQYDIEKLKTFSNDIQKILNADLCDVIKNLKKENITKEEINTQYTFLEKYLADLEDPRTNIEQKQTNLHTNKTTDSAFMKNCDNYTKSQEMTRLKKENMITAFLKLKNILKTDTINNEQIKDLITTIESNETTVISGMFNPPSLLEDITDDKGDNLLDMINKHSQRDTISTLLTQSKILQEKTCLKIKNNQLNIFAKYRSLFSREKISLRITALSL